MSTAGVAVEAAATAAMAAVAFGWRGDIIFSAAWVYGMMLVTMYSQNHLWTCR